MRNAALGFIVLTVVALGAAPSWGYVGLELTSPVATDGEASVDVVLATSTIPAGGMQGDLLFDSRAVRLERASACRINPEIGDRLASCEEDPDAILAPCKTLSRNLVSCGDEPEAPGCEGQAPHIDRFRGIVAATAVPNNNPIPEGTVVFSCTFTVVDAALLPVRIEHENVVVADPFGGRLDGVGFPGAILAVAGELPPTPTIPPLPTSTPTRTPPLTDTPRPTRTPTATPTDTPLPAILIVGDAEAGPEGRAAVEVALIGSDLPVGGLQNDILFDNTIVDVDGGIGCEIAPSISDRSEACDGDADEITEPCKTFNWAVTSCDADPLPTGCPERNPRVSRLRAIVAAIARPNRVVIPDGPLYTCGFVVRDGAALPAPLAVDRVFVSDPLGGRLPGIGAAGSIRGSGQVAAAPTWTPAPTFTGTPTYTPKPTRTLRPTRTQRPTNTPRPTWTPVPTATLRAPQENGMDCRHRAECLSDHCVNGVCCAVASCGEGESCGVTGSTGTCAAQLAIGEPCSAHRDCADGICFEEELSADEQTVPRCTQVVLLTPGDVVYFRDSTGVITAADASRVEGDIVYFAGSPELGDGSPVGGPVTGGLGTDLDGDGVSAESSRVLFDNEGCALQRGGGAWSTLGWLLLGIGLLGIGRGREEGQECE